MKKKLLAVLLSLLMVAMSLSPAFAIDGITDQTGADIRVMGWNLLNTPGVIENWNEYFTINKRGERTVDIISRYDADSIGFQEGNVNWKNYLNVNLTNYTIVPATQGATDPIYYRQDRVDLVDAGVFWLSATPDVPSKEANAAEERVCTWAIFRNKTTGVMYAHFNTHLDHISDQARTTGMRVIREKIESFRQDKGYENLGIVATGDFNSTRKTDAYQVMIGEYPNVNMQDSLYCAPQDKVQNEGETLIDGSLMIAEDLSSYDGGLAIDHLFVSIDALDVQSYKVMREGDRTNPRLAASDHFGIYVELNVGQGEIRRVDQEVRETAAYGNVTVDGVRDESYAQSTSGIIKSANSNSSVTLPKNEMTTAAYSFVHDRDYLYYFIDVTDYHVTDAEKHTGEDGAKTGIDGIEIYYNFLKGSTNPKEFSSETATNGECGYFTVYANQDSITYNATKVNSDVASVLGDYVAKHTETGYVIEGKIPLSSSVKLLLSGKDDIQIGMGFLINDDADNGIGGRDYYTVNAGDGDVLSAWGAPNLMLPLWLAPSEKAILPNSAAYGTPTLDGTMDEVYNKSDAGNISRATLNGTAELPDAEKTTATYRFVYDNNYLYYFIDVTDFHVTDASKHAGESGGDKGIDGIEIYYNFLKGTTNPTSYDGLSGEASYFTSYANGDANAKGFEYTAVHTEKGYVLEGKIPLHECMKSQLATADQPVEIGVGFVLNDDADNGAGGRDYYVVNEDKVLSAWSQPDQTSSLYLVPNKEAIVPNSIAYGTPEIDGTMDAAYDKSYAATFGLNGQNTTETNGTYQYLYDDNFLYYFIHITDSNVNSPETQSSEANGNGIDSAQLYFNFAKGTNSSTTYSSELVANNEAGFFTIFPNGSDAQNAQYAAANSKVYNALKEYGHSYTDDGYTLEGKIPLSASLKASITAGKTAAIGLGIQLNDDANDDGVRDNYLFSASIVGSAWGDPTQMQEYYLLKKPDSAGESIAGGAIDQSVQRAAFGTPVIDGTLDDQYLKSTADTFHFNGGSSDANGVYRFIHDNEYLYFFVDIADKNVSDPETVDQQTDHNGIDGVQLYYDFLNTDYNSSSNPDQYRSYTFSSCNQNGNEAGYFGMFANGNPIWLEQGSSANITYTAKHTNTGYVLEGKVPLSTSLKAKLDEKRESTMGFGLQLNDDTNNDGIRENYVMSQSSILAAWEQPYAMTDLILEPDYYSEEAAAHVAVSGTPEIDGKLDAAYDRSPAILLNKELYTNTVVTENATGAAKALYDSDYLYLFAEIQDDTLNQTDVHPKNDNYDLDGVQFYLDFTDGSSSAFTRGKSGYLILDVNDYSTTLQSGAQVDRWGGSDMLASVYKDNPDKCSWKVVRTDDGYNMEIRFELPEEVKAQIAAKQTANIGVGFQINDDTDNDGDRNDIVFSNGQLGDAWLGPQNIERMNLLPDYKITTNLTAEQGTVDVSAAYAGELVTPKITIADGMMLVDGSVKLNGNPFEIGSSFVMPAQDVQLTAEVISKPEEFPIILPDVEGLTITSDKKTAKPGELVTLNIQLADGYEFVQDDGMYDYGHFSNSQQKWVNSNSGPHGLYLMGRRLKVNDVSLTWAGNTFIMPDKEAVVTAEVEAHPIVNAVKTTITLDGAKDEAYADSKTIDVNRSTSAATWYQPGESRATGKISTAYDDQYLYCFAEINDPTASDMNAVNGDIGSAKSLLGFDNIVFFFDFLNTDTENTATNEYRFVENESGIFLIDALNLQQSSDGRIYDKLGGGFAAFNGNKSKADYVVVKNETGYQVELKIALSDSLKQKLAVSSETNRPEIGIGAMIMDDQDNNGAWDYEKSDKIICSSSLITNMWSTMQFVRTENGHLQVNADTSPRWLSRMTLDYAPEDTSSSSTSSGSTSQTESEVESTPGSQESSSEQTQSTSLPTDQSQVADTVSAASESSPTTGSASEQLIWIAIALAAAAVLAAGVIVIVQRKTYKE